MSIPGALLDFILHIDRYLGIIIANFGVLTYILLFIVVFCETGLVFTPFFPGDSLIFVAGTFASIEALNIFILFIILSLAAIIGDSVNYWVGHYFGKILLNNRKLIKQKYLERTKAFYKRHGGKTIIFARFIPIIRTFAPFVAGIGKMKYSRFLIFNITGGILWVFIFLFAGYFFGSIPFVKDNLSLVIILIIFVSIIPPIGRFLAEKIKKAKLR
jgi:membrane-associated protein